MSLGWGREMVIVFDVNGTLLDVSALNPRFEEVFGTSYSFREWFTEVVQYSMAVSLSGGFRDFGDIAADIFTMAAASRRISLKKTAVQDLRHHMQSLPPFPDAPTALARLKADGLRLAVLSNSGSAALERQLRNAKLDHFFERAISVSEIRRFKPAPEVYRSAARKLHVRTRQMWMVAAHPWDLLGADAAGCRTALMTRPGTAPVHNLLSTDLVAPDLATLASQVLGGAAERLLRRKRIGLDRLLLGAGLAAAGVAGTFLMGGARRGAEGKTQPQAHRTAQEQRGG